MLNFAQSEDESLADLRSQDAAGTHPSGESNIVNPDAVDRILAQWATELPELDVSTVSTGSPGEDSSNVARTTLTGALFGLRSRRQESPSWNGYCPTTSRTSQA